MDQPNIFPSAFTSELVVEVVLSALSVFVTDDRGEREPLWAQRPLMIATPVTTPILLTVLLPFFSPFPLPAPPPHARSSTSPKTSDSLSGTLMNVSKTTLTYDYNSGYFNFIFWDPSEIETLVRHQITNKQQSNTVFLKKKSTDILLINQSPKIEIAFQGPIDDSSNLPFL